MSNFIIRIGIILFSMMYLLLSSSVGRVSYEPFNGLSLVVLLFHIAGTLSLLYVFIGIIKDMSYFKKRIQDKHGARQPIR